MYIRYGYLGKIPWDFPPRKTHTEFAMHVLMNFTEDEYESTLSSPGVGKWKLKHIFILSLMLYVLFSLYSIYIV